jgi:branched-chain amino acid transport system ATP-binding protein
MSLLEVRGLEAFYGGSQALFGVDFEIAQGELVALMGRNGMGKTTTVRSPSPGCCAPRAARSGLMAQI